MTRSRRKMDPALARERRMKTYPTSYLDIMKAAKESRDYIRYFDEHSQAHAYITRYYRFRIDALEIGLPDATFLPYLQVTGINGDGTRYDSKYTEAPGPFTILWKHEFSNKGQSPMRYSEEDERKRMAESLHIPSLDEKPAPQPKKIDHSEEAVMKYLATGSKLRKETDDGK